MGVQKLNNFRSFGSILVVNKWNERWNYTGSHRQNIDSHSMRL